jgi:K+-transporting ATPase ATPase C chain
MKGHLASNLWLLALTVLVCSVLYPLVLWVVGQTVFPHQAEGSLIDENGNPVTDPAKARGSRLIGQPFKGNEYFQPRPSSAGNGYDASQSGASNWAASNPLLRSRVARALGPIVQYARTSPVKPGQPVGGDVEKWFRNQTEGDAGKKPEKRFVARWANDNPAVAEQYIKENPEAVAGWFKENAADKDLTAYRDKDDESAVAAVKADTAAAAKLFFAKFAARHPGRWPAVDKQKVQPKRDNSDDIKGYFFDLWLQDNKDAVLEKVPADMVMASGSGLDPHITLKNARYQLDHRVAEKQADKLLKDHPGLAARIQKAKLQKKVREAIVGLLEEKKEAPLGGLAGVDLVNVLELNIALNARMAKLVEGLQ